MNKADLSAKLSKHGQEHLLQFWDELNEEQKVKFSKELNEIDFELVNRKFQAPNEIKAQVG